MIAEWLNKWGYQSIKFFSLSENVTIFFSFSRVLPPNARFEVADAFNGVEMDYSLSQA